MLNGFESITCIGNNYCLQTVHPFFVGVVVVGGGVGDGDAGTVVVPCNIDYCVEANISRFNLSPYQHTREKKGSTETIELSVTQGCEHNSF